MPENIITFIFSFIILLVFFGALDFLLLFMIKKNVKWTLVITAAVAYFAAVYAGFYFMTKSPAEPDLATYVTTELNNNLDTLAAGEKKMGLTEEQIQNDRKFYDLFYIKTFPAWIFFTVLCTAFLNYFVVRLFAMRRYGVKSEIPTFELWHISEAFVWIFIAGCGILLADNYLPYRWLYYTGLNMAFASGGIYLLIGIAIMSFYLKKFRVPVILQFLIYALFLVSKYMIIAVALAGLFDTWFNFRKIQKEGYLWK
jgi:hypothetical protein